MTPLRNVLYNSLLHKGNVCCLCFTGVPENAIHIEDDVILNVDDISTNIEVSEVLGFILGSDVGEITSETICNQCATSAFKCYTFIKKCKENSRRLQKAITSLDNCLQNCTDKINLCNSLYVSLDENYTAQEFYDCKKPVISQCAILRRFKSLSSANEQSYPQEVKIEIDFDTDVEIPSVKQEISNRKSTKKRLRRATLSKDLILHTDSKALAYKCKTCLKTYQTLEYLRQHYWRVHAPKEFKCKSCERCYGTYALMEQHFQDCHSEKVCTECGKVYKNRYSLKQHELGHRRRFICQKCGRIYKNKDTFKQHIGYGICGQTTRKSATEGEYKCDICKKSFSRKNTLAVHIKFEHTNQGTAHVCSWCNKKFSCQSRLKAHTVKHTQEKNFSCEICNGKFVTKESLLYHTRIHTGEKPYKCNFCGLRFLSSSRRAEHVRRHHMNLSLACDVCGAKFKNDSCLLKHKQRHLNPDSRLFHNKVEVDFNKGIEITTSGLHKA